jgi:hypothetical protein
MQSTHGAANYMLRRRDSNGRGPRLCLIAASLSIMQSAARPIIYYDDVTAINGRGPRPELYLSHHTWHVLRRVHSYVRSTTTKKQTQRQ